MSITEKIIKEVLGNKRLLKETNEVFDHTIYRVPTKEELSKFNKTSLAPQQIFGEITYTIVGRGIICDENKRQVLQAAEILNSLNDDRYPEVLKLAKEYQNKKRFA